MRTIIHICETVKGGVGTYLNTFDMAFRDDLSIHYVVPAQHVDHLDVTGSIWDFNRPKRGAFALFNLIRTALTVVQKEPPAILVFQSSYALIVMAAFRLLRLPGVYVYMPHCWARLRYDTRPRLQRWISRIEGRLSRLADLTLNVSENDRRVAKAHDYGGHHVVVENAMPDLDTPARSDLFADIAETGKINLLFVGRFDRQKGLDLLLQAYAQASLQNPNLHLHVIGANVEESKADFGSNLPQSITFHGWIAPQQIPDYFASADLLLLPSRWESLPMVLIESLRSATPVMLSDTCNMSSLITQGKSGFSLPLTALDWSTELSKLDRPTLRALRPAARELYETRYSQIRFKREMTQLMNAQILQSL